MTPRVVSSPAWCTPTLCPARPSGRTQRRGGASYYTPLLCTPHGRHSATYLQSCNSNPSCLPLRLTPLSLTLRGTGQAKMSILSQPGPLLIRLTSFIHLSPSQRAHRMSHFLISAHTRPPCSLAGQPDPPGGSILSILRSARRASRSTRTSTYRVSLLNLPSSLSLIHPTYIAPRCFPHICLPMTYHFAAAPPGPSPSRGRRI